MKKVHRLADYAPPAYRIESIGLDVALDPDRTIVEAMLDIVSADATGTGTPLVLDGVGLEIETLLLDGKPLAPDRYRYDGEKLTIENVPAAFRLESRVAVCPRTNRSGSGLFFLDGKLATQCEPEGFRRLTFFADRPDVLARYRVRLTADETAFPTLLSNGNLLVTGRLSGGKHWALWDDPHPKPSYIFAIAAGRFETLGEDFVTASGRKVKLAMLAGEAAIGDCAFALAALARALRWDEEVFGLEYDLERYNVVALEGWAGATENKGLNIFGAGGILADPRISTDDELITIERVVGHEVFHNWTGNRVTCREWFQLSLKEGLTRYRDQLFMESRLGRGAWRIEMVKALRRNQFPEDDGAASHPVQLAEYSDIDNFYSNTIYDKGAELIRMLAALVGEESFIRAVQLYLERHDGEAVTIDEFLAAIEAVSGRKLGAFRRWYESAGRPIVSAEGEYRPEARQYVLTLRQRMPAGGASESAPLLIPVRAKLVGPDGAAMGAEILLELGDHEQSFVFDDIDAPPVPSLLRGFSAPVSIAPFLDAAALGHLAAHDDDPFARWDAVQRLGVDCIRALAADAASPPGGTLEHVFAACLSDREIDPFFASQLLTLPDEPVLSEGLAVIPLDAHQMARQRLRREIAGNLEARLWARYAELGDEMTGGFDPVAIGRRKLRNICLEWLSALGRPDIDALCLRQLCESGTMTDSFAALSILVDRDCPERDVALGWFHERWQGRPTVIDKWFGVQALSRAPGAIDRIIGLAGHPDFETDNMARLLAYYGGLFRQNRVAFHDLSGKGYAFLADTLLAMDALGRGGAAWVMPQINLWRRHQEPRQKMMRSALERVAGTAGISRGLREVVEGALQ